MSGSRNARFSGPTAASVEIEHPAGESIARTLFAELPDQGVSVGGFDIWRDCGWSFTARVAEDAFLVALAAVEAGWFVQIAPEVPGAFRRETVGRVHERAARCHFVALAIQSILVPRDFFDFRWRMDGPPEPSDPGRPG